MSPDTLSSQLLGVSFAGLFGAASSAKNSQQIDDSSRRNIFGAWIGLVLVIALTITHCLFLVSRLDSLGSPLLTWEGEVLAGFERWLVEKKSLWDILLENLRWDDGLMSSGHHSLLYGIPTYWLLSNFEFSPSLLRISAIIALAFGTLGMYVVLRSAFSPLCGVCGAVLFLYSPIVNYYGVYGTSQMATIACAVWSLVFLYHFATRPHPGFLNGLVLGLALCATTLHYSPGRLVVLVMAAALLPRVVILIRRRQWQPVLGLALTIAPFLLYQSETGAHHSFFRARGEQIVTILENPRYVRHFAPSLSDTQISALNEIDILKITLSVTLEQLATLSRPQALSTWSPTSIPALGDPPALPFLWFETLPFLALGLIRLARGRGTLWRLTLISWLVLLPLAILLTTRVDAHRIALLIVPLIILTASGLGWFLESNRLPTKLIGLVSAVFVGAFSWLVLQTMVHPLALSPKLTCIIDQGLTSPRPLEMYLSLPFPDKMYLKFRLSAKNAWEQTGLANHEQMEQFILSSSTSFPTRLSAPPNHDGAFLFAPKESFERLRIAHFAEQNQLSLTENSCGFVLTPWVVASDNGSPTGSSAE